MKKLILLSSLLLTLCGCGTFHMVTVHERNIASYDVGKAIESAIKKVESTGYYVSEIEIEKASQLISKNGADEWRHTYNVTVYGDHWEKRMVYFYYRTAPNYEGKVKKRIENRMKENNVWVNN